MTKELSKEQVALYDRQIRLWGMAAQQKIANAHVVMIGKFTGVAQEIIKNLVLKGVSKISLIVLQDDPNGDCPLATEGMLFPDLDATILNGTISNTRMVEVIQRAAQSLNPMVETASLSFPGVSSDEFTEFLKMTNFVCLSNEVSLARAFEINAACRNANVSMLWTLTNAFDAMFISDFGPVHAYTEERRTIKDNGEEITEVIQHQLKFPSMETLWNSHKSIMKDYTAPKRVRKAMPLVCDSHFLLIQERLENESLFGSKEMFWEVAPVNAIMGGLIAQEVIKVITGKDLPIHNVVLFDGHSLDSKVISIKE